VLIVLAFRFREDDPETSRHPLLTMRIGPAPVLIVINLRWDQR
jgi:hypothetical protein